MNKDHLVHPGVPGVLPGLPEGSPRDRLALARWLVSERNPLTARVIVNRFWSELFGVGIVETLEDFGSSGLPPSHPQLLDDLAVRFQQELGWSVKRLLRELVTSAAYRQDADATPGQLASDPRNRMVARGPRTRLSAEMIRDQALVVSGLLSNKIGGPSVMPYQPDGIWQSVYNGSKWEVSDGSNRYRRAVYTYWKRTSPYPSFLMFDAPSREVCTGRRIPTNTPLQALVTMNDPVYVECAKSLAQRVQAEAGSNAAAQVRLAMELATGRQAEPEIVERLLRLYCDAAEQYRNRPETAEHLAGSPDEAAMVLVANTILNLDVVLMK